MHIKQYKTAKSLRILTDFYDSVQSVAIIIMIKAGGLYEEPANCGITHFLEHMAFKGTDKYNYREIAHKFDSIGGNFNAFTTKDRTVFYVKCLKNKICQALDLLAEILINSTLSTEEIEKERKVIMQEMAQNDDVPDNYIFDLYHETAFANQRLGWNILGTKDFINNVTRDDLLQYMAQFYTQENTLIAISGNMDEAAVVDYINDKFQHYRSGGLATITEPKSQYTPGVMHKKQDLEQVHLILGFPGVGYHDDYLYAQNVGSLIMGEGMSSRLFQKIRENLGLTYNISSLTAGYHDIGIFAVYASVEATQVRKTVENIWNEITNFAGTITDEELEVAKVQLSAHTFMAMENTSARAEKIASNLISHGRVIPIEEIEERIMSVTKEKINDYFTRIILKSPPTFVSIGSETDVNVHKFLEAQYGKIISNGSQ